MRKRKHIVPPAPVVNPPAEPGEFKDARRLVAACEMFFRRETYDAIGYLKSLRLIEVALNRRMAETLYEIRWGIDEAHRRLKHSDKERMLEAFEMLLRTQIARDKFMFYGLGLLETRKGDLRTARLVPDEREQLFAILRFDQYRQHPGTIAR